MLVLFSTPVPWSSRYARLVRPAMSVWTLVPLPLVPMPSSSVTLPAAENSQAPMALATTLVCVAVIVSLAPVVSPVVSSENHRLIVTPSAWTPELCVYS